MARFFIWAVLILSPLVLFAQYPNTPGKTRLGYGTTADGLTYRGNGAPATTPTGYRNYAYVYLDSTSGDFYAYYLSGWNRIAGISWYDSLLIDRNVVFGGGVNPYLPLWDTDSQLGISIARQSGDSVIVIEGGLNIESVHPLGSGDSMLVWRNNKVYRRGFRQALSAYNAVSGTGLESSIPVWATDSTLGPSLWYLVSNVLSYNNLSPSAGAVMSLESATNSVIMPRGTVAQRPGSPIAGMLRYQSDTSALEYYDTDWRILANRAWVRTLLSGYSNGTGATNRVAYWSDANTLTSSSSLTYDGTTFGVSDGNTATAKPILLDQWTDAGAPSAATGQIGYNATSGNLVYRGAAAWEYPVKSSTGTGLGTAGRVFYANSAGRAAADDLFSWDASNDRLGIGTATASYPLDVRGSGVGGIMSRMGNTLPLYLSSNSPFVGFNLRFESSNWRYGTSGYAGWIGQYNSGGRIVLAITSATGAANAVATPVEVITVLPNQNVGIGVSPSHKLHVSSGVQNIIYATSSAVAGRITVDNATSSQYDLSASGTTKWRILSHIPTGTNYSLDFYNNQLASSAIFVNGDNNRVGVGTSSPSYRLHVSGTSRDVVYVESSDPNAARVTVNHPVNAGVDYSISASRKWATGTYLASAPNYAFVFYNEQTLKNTVFLDGNNDFVGLSTNTPAYILDVNGTGAIRLPSGTTAQRPTSADYILRGNTTNTKLETYYSAAWHNIATETWVAANYATPAAITWTLAGDTGTPQAVTSTQTATWAGGWGINTSVGGTRTVTVEVDSSQVATQYDISGFSSTWLKEELEANNNVQIVSNRFLSIEDQYGAESGFDGGGFFSIFSDGANYSYNYDLADGVFDFTVFSYSAAGVNRPNINLYSYSDESADIPQITFGKLKLTAFNTATASIDSGWVIGRVSYSEHAYITGQSTETWIPGSRGTKIVFSTTSNATNTASDRLTIDQDGSLDFHAYGSNTFTSTHPKNAMFADGSGNMGEKRWVRPAYTSDADLTIGADTLAVALEHRIYMEVTSGASSATEVTIPDAGATYLHTSVVFTCKDDSGSYACIVNANTATIMDPGIGTDVSTYTISPYKTVVFRVMQTGASTYRWTIQD